MWLRWRCSFWAEKEKKSEKNNEKLVSPQVFIKKSTVERDIRTTRRGDDDVQWGPKLATLQRLPPNSAIHKNKIKSDTENLNGVVEGNSYGAGPNP